jgi:hypothetical protein
MKGKISRRAVLRSLFLVPASLTIGKASLPAAPNSGTSSLMPVTDFQTLKANVMAFCLRERPLGPASMAVLGELDKAREIYDDGYLSFQRSDGMFLSKDYAFDLWDSEPRLLERLLIHQRTFIGHSVFLGHVPEYQYAYLESMLVDPEKGIPRFLDSMNWKFPWTMGNVDMVLAYVLHSQWRTFGDERAKLALDAWIKWHCEHADPKIGFWDPAGTGNLHSVMAGGAHQLGIHFMFNLDVPYPDRMVDTALGLQNNIGMFAWEDDASHNSSDFDGLFILTNLYHRYDYRRDDIRRALELAMNTTLKHGFAPEGGGYNRYGVSRKPDAWSTMVRLLTVGYAARMLGIQEFKSLEWTFKPWHPFTVEDGGIRFPHWESGDWVSFTGWPVA